MTVLNKRIHGPRRFATQHYELERVKAIAKKAGATINDVFLAICAGALRRYLKELGELPEQSLIAALPVSVRPAEDAAVGNAISSSTPSSTPTSPTPRIAWPPSTSPPRTPRTAPAAPAHRRWTTTR